MPPCGAILGTSDWEETPGQTHNTPERLYIQHETASGSPRRSWRTPLGEKDMLEALLFLYPQTDLDKWPATINGRMFHRAGRARETASLNEHADVLLMKSHTPGILKYISDLCFMMRGFMSRFPTACKHSLVSFCSSVSISQSHVHLCSFTLFHHLTLCCSVSLSG